MTPIRRVAVVVDSTVSLPTALLEGLPLHIVPLKLDLDGTSYLDGVDLTPGELYRRLPSLQGLPKSSAPSPASFLAAFHEAALHAEDLLCVTLTSRLSGTYDAARTAIQVAGDELPDLRIRLLDSTTAGGAEGLVALAAARTAAEGRSLNEVFAVAERVSERVHFLGVMETLHYVWKGGHIPRVALWASTLLDIKPVLDIWRGEVRLVGRPRTKAKGIARMLATMAKRVGEGPLHVVAMHADAPDEAEELLRQVQARFACAEALIVPFTPVIGAHTGPGLLAVAFYEE